jgi:UDP-N-acetylmuramoyl-tripeptide--D-alanyl-D-alanine ligase
MIPLSLTEIAQALGGELVGKNITINSINTDSRALKNGELFLALKGPNFDAHRFLNHVVELGCAGVIVDHQCELTIPQIIVTDTHKALGELGAYVKEKVSPKTVAITGSSGKTTVKEMVAAILSRLGNVLATKGNFNNDIGVPLTLLRLEQQHDFAVVELGANHLGEIAYTTALVKPDVAIINNIAAAHLEGFGDLCGVARAKGEIFEGLNSNGVALYNLDCKLANKWQWRLTDKKVRRFSCFQEADCFSSDVTLDDNGCASFQLNTDQGNAYIELTVPGKHNVCNAVAAATIALEFGSSLNDIRLGLLDMSPVQGRMNLHQLTASFKLIDDTYNANVESIKAATDLLSSYSGRRVLILGDMGELGAQARSYHQEVGEYAKASNIDDLLTIGVLSQSTADAFNGRHFSDRAQLIHYLISLLENEQQNISILVKGSRSARMENVVKDIMNWRENAEQPSSILENNSSERSSC